VEAGLFGPPRSAPSVGAVSEQHAPPVSEATWEIAFPPLPPEAFAVLARIVACSVRGARRLELREHAPEPALLVTDFTHEDEMTLPDVPWRLRFEPSHVPEIAVTFQDPLTDPTHRRLTETLGAWTTVVGLGGDRATDRRLPSVAEPWRIDRSGDRAARARFACLDAEHSAFEALFEALLTIDEAAPIAAVTVATLPIALSMRPDDGPTVRFPTACRAAMGRTVRS
jgi:hypothetical protein